MKFFYAVLILSYLIFVVNAYSTIVQNAFDPEHPDKCYDKNTKKYYAVGNNRVEGKCERAHCSLNDHELTITGCNSLPQKQGCELRRGDLYKSYPDCCDRNVCQ
uniref:CSON006116 protein n=1 Tax=Culicoides sonorensis TaxID=179676 RepID=A0A336LW12_CULSO